ncbi:MAG TPA: complex I NDUFA9 subunit family protein [Gammaproteobacteria bacterium]|nr:complex I NDUFA9 subunit family protein [Gammaproteobacteria bacterium]
MTVKPLTRTFCVLGGTGFVGRRLVSHLVREGYRVRVPTRNRQRHRDLLVLPGLELPAADVHDEQALPGLIRGCEAVVNLVGILNEPGHDGSGFSYVHVDLTAKLLGACRESGVRRVVHMSALKANAERGPSRYLKTKGQAEQLLKSQNEIDYTIFRPSAIFGPGDSFTTRFARLLKRLPILPLPCPEARMAPVFVEDVARAFTAALRENHVRNRAYELCGPDVYSLLEIVQLIRRELGIRRAIVPLPRPLGRLQAWAGDYLVPGKPFTLDNFKSLGVPAVCAENGLDSLKIQPSSLTALAPTYLRPRAERTLPRGPRTPLGAQE